MMRYPKGMNEAPDIREIDVTPALAAVWLEKNNINRRINKGRVSQYARAMAVGKWLPSNDAICLASDGTLLNGQHRLRAVIQSGVKVKMLVRNNMPQEAMARMDRQFTRTYTHQLALRGEQHTALLGSTLRLCAAFEQGVFPAGSGGSSIGDVDMDVFLELHPEIRHSVEVGSQLRTMVDATPTSIASAHWWISRTAGPDYPAHFLHQLGEPINEPPESAVHPVRRRLKSARFQKWENRNYVYLMVRGWNAYTQRRTLVRPQMAPGDKKFSLPDPLPYNQDILELMP